MSLRHQGKVETQDSFVDLLIPRWTSAPIATQRNKAASQSDAPPDTATHAWDERLAPFSAAELRRIKGTTFSVTRADPKTLNQTLDAARATGDPVAMTCAWVRCKLLQLPVADYARLAGLGENTIRSLERGPDTQKPKRDAGTFSTLIKAWDTIAQQSIRQNPACAAELRQAREMLLDSLPGANTTATFGILQRWRYEVGEALFSNASGWSYGNLWQRRKQGALFNALELVRVGQKLDLLPISPPEILTSHNFQKLHSAWIDDCHHRGRPRSMAMLHMLLALTDIHPTGTTLHEHPDMRTSLRLSEKVAGFSQASWEDVAPVISFLRSKGILNEGGTLECELREQFAREAQIQTESFETRLRDLSQQQGIDASKLVDVFGLRSPDRTKPALPIYRALHYGEYDRSVPPGVLALVLAPSREEAAELINLKRREIADTLIREGRRVSRLLVERRLWKIGYTDLAHSKADIQSIEWGAPCALNEHKVVREALVAGLERAHAVLCRWQRLHDHNSIRSTIASLLYETSGAELESRLQSSARRLRSIAVGGEVPPLPTVTQLLGRDEGTLAPHLVRNWFDSYAKFQAGVNQTDLERLLATFIASRSDTLGGYFESRGLSQQTGARIFSAISNCGTVSADQLEVITKALGIEPGSAFHALLSLVRATGTIAEALPRFAEFLQRKDGVTFREVKALARAFASDYREQSRSKRGEFSLAELLDIRYGEAPAPKTLKGEESLMGCLHNLPGLTAQELRSIIQATSTDSKRCVPSRNMQELLARATERGISQEELVFALQRSVAVARQSGQQTSRAIAIPLATPLTAPAVLAHVVSADEMELAQRLAACREQARLELLAVGLKATPLQIEMRVWGIRNDDIRIERHEFGRILWSSSAQSAAAKNTLQLVAELGAMKAANTLERLIAGRSTTLLPDLSQIFNERHPSGSTGLSVDARLPLGASARFAAGVEVPNVRQLEAMARACSFELSLRHRISHHFAQAEQIAAEVSSPLVRFVTHLALLNFENSAIRSEKKSLQIQAYESLLARAGLPTAKNLAILRNSNTDVAALWKLSTRILRGMGHSESSPLYDYALCLFISDDVPAALARWGKGLHALSHPFPALEPLRAFCSEIVGVSSSTVLVPTLPELFQNKERTIADLTQESALREILALARLVPGARICDLVQVPEQSRYALVFAKLKARATEQVVADDGASSSAIEFARRPARQARDEEERAAQSEKEARLGAQQALEHEQSIVQILTQRLGGASYGYPSAERVSDWANVLATILKRAEVEDLPRRYTSLLLAVREAPKRNLSYETAFVRKVLELLERDDRLKSRSGNDSGPKVYSLNT